MATVTAPAEARPQASSTIASLKVSWAVIDSPIGPLSLAGTDQGLLMLSFGDPESMAAELTRRMKVGGWAFELVEDPTSFDEVRQQLNEYFAGTRQQFTFELDRRLWRGFRGEVLAELEKVPFGQAVTYADLAARAGRPRAVRAVGSAMSTNPHPIVVACHRVLRTGGGVGGYGGGLDAKRWLLAHEQAHTF